MKSAGAPYHLVLEDLVIRFFVYLFVVIPAKLFGLFMGLIGRGIGALVQLAVLPLRLIGWLFWLITLPLRILTAPFRWLFG